MYYAQYVRATLTACMVMATAHPASAVDVAAFDFDANGLVDQEDAEWFFTCGSGPALPAGGGACSAQMAYMADRDGDRDVDQDDFGAFQRCLSGTQPAQFDCVPPIPPLPLLEGVAGYEDTPLLLTLTAFDPHSEPLAVSFAVTTLPAQGQLSQADGTPIDTVPAVVTDPGGQLQYLAEPDMSGPAYAAFGYTVTSLASGTTSAGRAVSIDIAAVNDWPVLDVTPIVTVEDTPVTFQLQAIDPDEGDSFSFQLFEAPVSGTLYQVDESGVPQLELPLTQGMLVSNSQGLVHYVPQADYYGTDSLRGYVFDQTGMGQLPRVLPIHVVGVNDPPTAYNATFESPNSFGALIRNINLQASDVDDFQSAVQVCITTLPETGLLSTFPDGVAITQVPFCTTVRHFQYLYPHPEDLGGGCLIPPADLPTHFPLHVSSFAYEAFDGEAHSSTAHVNLQFVYDNTAPYVTSVLEHTTDEDVPAAFTLSGADIDGNELLFFFPGPPSHGVVMLNGAPLQYPVLVYNDTTLTFVPAENFNTAGGELATVPFQVLDNFTEPRDCPYAVTFTINPVNDPPKLMAPDYADTDELTYIQYGWFSFVGDDAFADTLLKVEVMGTGVANVNVVIPVGLASLEQVSPTHIRMQGTMNALNATFNIGVWVAASPGHPPGATLEITVDDQGNSGSGASYTDSLLIPVQLGTVLE